MTHRRVLGIALPIVVSNATVPLLGIVDTGVVGQMGAAAPIGAVGIGAMILSALYWIFGFLRMGTTGLAGQALGRRDEAEVSAILVRVLLIAGAAGLLLILLQAPLFTAALALSPASAEVEGLAQSYLAIRIWSAPFAIATLGLTGWLIAQERTRAVLAIQVVMNGINIGLDLLFVIGFGWGVDGVAVATLIAEVSGAALALWLCRAAFARPGWRDWTRIFDRTALRLMASVNRDILIRSLLVQAIYLSFLFLAADFGDVTLAANQVLMQFLQLSAHILDGFAFAAEALVARAFGAGAVRALRRGARLTGLWALALMTALSAAFALFGSVLIDAMTTAEDVRAAARLYQPWVVAAPVVGVWAYMLDGVFIGATRARDMRNMMILSAAIYALAVIVLTPGLGNHGLWAAMIISFLARGVTLGLRYPALERAARRA
ncbi:MAG: MATE family efflux transporter [Pseudomonadota bacterium]